MQAEQQTPCVDAEYLLEKFPGKGGWTYACIPEIAQDKNKPFGWVIVSGTIDGYTLDKYKLMPMGNGKLFLPVKASIRKLIQKEAGDKVRITLFVDQLPSEITEELQLCFAQEPEVLFQTFLQLTDKKKQNFLHRIYSCKTEEEKAQQIVKMMEELSQLTSSI